MKKRAMTILLALVFALTSVQLTFAADVADNWTKASHPAVNKVISGVFEKDNDVDCYTFIAGGGSYTIYVYSKDPVIPDSLSEEEIKEFESNDFYDGFAWKNMPFQIDHGALYNPKRDSANLLTTETQDYLGCVKDKDGWYVADTLMGEFDKGDVIGIRFFDTKKGNYKFKIEGKASPTIKKATLRSVKGKKKAIAAKWGKVSGANGYQIQYSPKKNFSSGVKTVNVKKGSTLSKTIKVKKKGKYYVRVRAYKNPHGFYFYGNWSAVKSTKVK